MEREKKLFNNILKSRFNSLRVSTNTIQIVHKNVPKKHRRYKSMNDNPKLAVKKHRLSSTIKLKNHKKIVVKRSMTKTVSPRAKSSQSIAKKRLFHKIKDVKVSKEAAGLSNKISSVFKNLTLKLNPHEEKEVKLETPMSRKTLCQKTISKFQNEGSNRPKSQYLTHKITQSYDLTK